MQTQNVSLNLEVERAEIPDSGTPQPTLVAITRVTNNGADAITIDSDDFAFELFSRRARPIETLPIANLVIENDAASYSVSPGEQIVVRTSLKFEPDAVDNDHKYLLKVLGLGAEVSTEFCFVDQVPTHSSRSARTSS